MVGFGFDVWNESGVFVARLWHHPDFEAHTGSELLKLFQAHIDVSGRPDIVLDLSGVGWLNSEILSRLVMLHKRSKRFVICHAEPVVREVFHICGLTKLFHFEKDLPTALEFLKNLDDDPSVEFRDQEIP